MKQAILLHGTQANGNSNWLPWLSEQLQQKGMQVYIPDLPHADYPSLQEWTDYVHANCPFAIDQDTAIIGHSAGAVAALILTQHVNKVGKVVAVAAFKDLTHLHDVLDWHANDRFLDIPFDFTAIQKSCSDIVFLHSDDDPYCPTSHAEYLAVQTNGTLHIQHGYGHFNTEKDASFTQMPIVLSLL